MDKKSSGWPARIFTKRATSTLKRLTNNKSGISQRKLAKSFECYLSYINKKLDSLAINCWKKTNDSGPYWSSNGGSKIKKCDSLSKIWRSTMDIGWWELFHSKKDNPANLPEARPIEDFWFILKDKVYENGWEANSWSSFL